MSFHWNKFALFLLFSLTILQFQNCSQQSNSTEPSNKAAGGVGDNVLDPIPPVITDPDPEPEPPVDPPTPKPPAETDPSCTIEAATNKVAYKGTVEVKWESKNANSAVMSWYKANGTESTVSLKGTWVSHPLYADTPFKLTVYDKDGKKKSCSTKVAVTPPANVYVLGTGQSNMAQYFSGSPLAKTYFEEQLPKLDSTIKKAVFLNGAYGGSAVLKVNVSTTNPENYWLEQNATTLAFSPGPRLKLALDIIKKQKADGKDINYILWAQGEMDAASINSRSRKNTSTEAAREAYTLKQLENYKNGMKYLFNSLRVAGGSPFIHIGIQVLGQRNVADTATSKQAHISIHHIRAIQNALSTEMTNVRILAEMYDTPLVDTVHMSYDGKVKVLARMMKNIALERKDMSLFYGVKMSKVARLSSNKKKLTLTVANSTGLTVGSNAAHLFSIHSVNTTYIMRAKSVKKINDTTLELEFPSDVPANSKLLTAYGILCPEGTKGYGYDLEKNNRYIFNKHKIPMVSSSLAVK